MDAFDEFPQENALAGSRYSPDEGMRNPAFQSDTYSNTGAIHKLAKLYVELPKLFGIGSAWQQDRPVWWYQSSEHTTLLNDAMCGAADPRELKALALRLAGEET